MFTATASSNLASLSYRIANEPNFTQKLMGMIESRKLESGQLISEEDAVVLKNYLDQGATSPQAGTDWAEEPGEYETWVA